MTVDRRTMSVAAREIKFLVTVDEVAAILAWVRLELAADPYGAGPHGDQYVTTSLYFDTSDGAVLERRGSFGRAKFRIRRYGMADWAFLERKLRTGRQLAKRRTAVSLEALVGGTVDAGDPTAWFARRVALRRLRPVCQVRYLRTARLLRTPAGVARVTLDEDLTALRVRDLSFGPGAGVPVVEGRAILEIKIVGPMPAALRRMAETFALSPVPYSKFRASMARLGAAPVPTELLCA